MHTKHEGKEEGVITMVVVAGLFILGKLIGGNKLTDPRVFTTFLEKQRDPKTGKIIINPVTGEPIEIPKMQLAPLPGTPPFVYVGSDGLKYPYPTEDKNMMDLYYRVTNPQSNIVMPTGGLRLVTPDVSGKLN